MVHALVLLHQALAPDGTLVDLRPDRLANPQGRRARQPHVYCVQGGRRVHAGYLKTLKPLATYRAADHAVRQVIRQELFTFRAVEAFDFHYYFHTLECLDRALATRWTSTVLEASTRRRLGTLLRAHPAAQIMAVDRIRLSVLMKRATLPDTGA